jgi:hypothetical protein
MFLLSRNVFCILFTSKVSFNNNKTTHFFTKVDLLCFCSFCTFTCFYTCTWSHFGACEIVERNIVFRWMGYKPWKNIIEAEGFVLVKPKLIHTQGEAFYEAICDCMGKLFNKLSFKQKYFKLLYVHVVVKQLLRLSQQPDRAPSTPSIGCPLYLSCGWTQLS